MTKTLLFISVACFVFLFFIHFSHALEVGGTSELDETANSCCLLKHTLNTGEGEVPKANYVGRFFEGDSKDTAGSYCIDYSLTANKAEVISPGDAETADNLNYYKTPGWAGYCLIDSVATVTDWIKWLAGAITIVAILVAGIMFITAGGNPEKVGTAKKMILYSIIGVAIIVSAQMVPSLIKFFI